MLITTVRFWSQMASYKAKCEPADNCLTVLLEFLTHFFLCRWHGFREVIQSLTLELCVGPKVTSKNKYCVKWDLVSKENICFSFQSCEGVMSFSEQNVVPSVHWLFFEAFSLVLKVSGTVCFHIIIIQLLEFIDLAIKTFLHQVLHRYFIETTNLCDVL